MKCPKCNYISFDFNQTCPKCKKELGDVRGKMNHFSFKPGSISISGLGSRGATETVTMIQKTGADMEETTELDFSDDLDFDMPEESSPKQNEEKSDLDMSFDDASNELSLEFDAFDMDDAASPEQQNEQTIAVEDTPDSEMDLSFEDDSVELSLDFDEPSLGDNAPKTPQTEETVNLEDSLEKAMDFSFEDESDEISLDFDEPSVGDAAPEIQKTEQEAGMEDSIEASLDLAFEEETNKDEDINIELKFDEEDDLQQSAVLDPSEKDEVTAAFDLDNLEMDPETDSGLEFAEDEDETISVELEESISFSNESAEASDSFPNLQETQGKINPSEMKVLDLELDLDGASNK